MTDTNQLTQSQSVSENKETHSHARIFIKALQGAKSSTKAAVFALTLGLASVGASGDAQGEGIDNSLSAPEIQQKIDELEGRGLDALSDEEFNLLFAYQDQLLALEKSETAEQEATIEAEKSVTAEQEKILNDLEEINNTVSGV